MAFGQQRPWNSILFAILEEEKIVNHLQFKSVADQRKSLNLLENTCSWCHQEVSRQSTEIIGSQGTVFCSENCFLSWRRASFKRAKTCDFCKSIRNAVSYVDFNDGATQLQFCSDKCLNQYKMQIFWRETQAHLELNPHLKEKKDAEGKTRTMLYLRYIIARKFVKARNFVDNLFSIKEAPPVINHQINLFTFCCRKPNYAWFVAQKLSFEVSVTRRVSYSHADRWQAHSYGENNCHPVATLIIVYNHIKLG